MYYAPHTLQRKRVTEDTDDYGRIVSTSDVWTDVCACRCDDNTNQEFSTAEGHVYRPKYHIVAEPTREVSCGDEVRVLNADGSVRGHGVVYNVKMLNVLPYTDIWV